MNAFSPVPVILDTDIGSDIDDTWALAQLLRCPELDPKLILTSAGDVAYRTAVTARFLQVSGRSEIPIGRGIDGWELDDCHRNQDPWIKKYDLADYPGEIDEDGVGRMIRIIEESSVPVTVIAIGPAVSLAAALERAPGIASRCRLVGMFGSFEIGYNGAPPACGETNVRMAPEAFRAVMAAPWMDVLLTPLDTCNFATLTGPNYHRIWSAAPADRMISALIENYCLFAPRVNWMHCDFFTQRSTTLFDSVAVYLAYDESFVKTEVLRFDITEDGFTKRDEAGPFTARVALEWADLEAFQDHLTDRLLGIASKPAGACAAAN